MNRFAIGVAVAASFLLGACQPPAPASVAPPSATSDNAGQKKAYEASIATAAIASDKIALAHPLKQIDPAKPTTKVVSWMTVEAAHKYYATPTVRLGGDAWVTADPELRDICRKFPTEPAALRLRLQQALGLPPVEEARMFVVMEVPTRLLVRPCPNPDPSTLTCNMVFPATAKPEYRAWFAEQVVKRYRDPEGYPWTRLGYTYDWVPTGQKVALSEFVVRAGGQVKVLDRVQTDTFCQAPRP